MENEDSSFQTLCARQIASWQLRELGPKDIDPNDPIAGIPSLQRNLVWRPAQTELLWDSLLRGFPIGAFVLCRRLKEQETHDEKEAGGYTHHLLDGQQRANAIALGFEDPFSGEESQDGKPILWLDLNPQERKGTRTFLVRLTTKAHPWGYAADDAASPLGIATIRTWLEKHHYMKDGNLVKKRPSPNQCWPLEAKIPVPFSWLVNACEGSRMEDFWEAIQKKCVDREAIQRKYDIPDETWAKHAVDFLAKLSNRGVLEPIRTAIQRALAAQIVCLELPKHVLNDPSAQESLERGGQETVEGRDNIANVEHLFQRLNAGGTTLDGDELVYSMIKAYWPQVKEPIRHIAEKRMPEARLFTLAARAALSLKKREENEKKRQMLQGRLSVSDIRQFGAILKPIGEKNAESEEKISILTQERLTKARKIRDFIVTSGSTAPNNRVSLETVLSRIERWLEKDDDNDDIGLPSVLKTSIARVSPEIWLLLMWLARQALENSDQDSLPSLELRKRILGLATALHWFGYDKGRAVQLIAEALSDKPLERNSKASLLKHTNRKTIFSFTLRYLHRIWGR